MVLRPIMLSRQVACGIKRPSNKSASTLPTVTATPKCRNMQSNVLGKVNKPSNKQKDPTYQTRQDRDVQSGDENFIIFN